MARPAVRRPPTRRSAELMPVTAATQLAPLPVTWARDSVVCAAAGVGGWGAAPLLAYPQWGIPALGVGVAAAVVRGVTGRRAQARAELTDRLVEALTPTLGLRSPDRRTVKLRAWTRGWPGHPRRIELRYAPGIDDSNPDWLADVVAATSRRLLESYTVARHDRRRARLRLVLAGPEELRAEKPLVQARAERTVIELLGSTTTITKVTFDHDQLVQLVASHEAGTRLAAPQYRARIERVISTMLPGRWRARWDLEGDTVTFEVRPTLPSNIDHPTPVVTKENRYRLPMAVLEDGGAMSWNMRGTAPHLMVVGKTGSGKQTALTTPVPTPAGWTTMGELVDGDTIFDETGQTCTVTTAHPVMYDRPTYEVVFSDGSTIVADAEHLWLTEARLDRVSQSNRRHKAARRSEPRTTRMTTTQLEQLQQAATALDPAAELSLPELARLAGMDPLHTVLQQIAAAVGPHGTRVRPHGEFHYPAQTVTQTQTVTVFDRPAALQWLAARAARPQWRYPTTAAELTTAAARATAGEDLTLAEVADLLHTTVDTAVEVMRRSRGHVDRSTSRRTVELQVPERTLTRQLPGCPITTYLATDLLRELIAWGQGLAKDRHQPRPAGAVRTTAEIAATLTTPSGHLNHSIPVAGCVQYPTAQQPLPAYALGAWLGDGAIWNTEFTSADPEVAVLIEATGLTVVDKGRPACKPAQYKAHQYRIRGIRHHLNDLKLLRCADHRRSRTKHIPSSYLIADEQQRRALLAGLLDTAGIVARQGAALFDNTNRDLAYGVHELVCSLGYRGAIREGRARLNGRDCGPKWTVSFTTTDRVFGLERKHLLHKERTARTSIERTRSRYITEVRPVASVPMRCLTVDSPSRLYLVGKSFIPTHNTVTITGVVMEATYREWPVWICDPKTVEFIGLRRWPNVQIVATSIEDMVTVILKAQQEMERRYSLVEAELADDDDFEPLVLVLDEYRDFIGMVTAWWSRIKVKGMPTRCPVFEAVASLARKGRTARIHVILGTQRPDADFLGGEMRDNFASRISLGRLSPQGAMMMWEAAYIGVSVPRGVPGRGTAVDDDDLPVEVQGYWTPDPRRAEKKEIAEDLAILERLRPDESAHRPLKVSLADELLYDLDADPGKDDPAPNWWAAIQEAQLVPALDFELSPKAATWELTKRLTGTTPVVEASAEPADDDPETIAGGAGADELDEDFDVEQDVPARRVRPGDRLLVEPALDFWAVVEFAEPDIDDEDLVCIDWRGDTDEAGSTSLPTSELVSIRRPLIEAAEQ